MAIEYAVKYAAEIDKKFTLGCLTACAVNSDYEFAGVRTVKVYNIPTAAMNNYSLTGSSRYGAPGELQNTAQELTLTRDRSFTFTIDKRSAGDTMGAMNAGSALQRQLDEVVIPEIDVYRLSVMAANAGGSSVGAVSASNAYTALLDASVYLTDQKCPVEGRIAFISPAFFKAIKLDPAFVKVGEIGQELLVRGQVGMVDGIRLVQAPTSYLPDKVELLVTHPGATVGAQKLAEYKVHDNPPGINGALVEGRVLYDAFVLTNKKGAIYVRKNS